LERRVTEIDPVHDVVDAPDQLVRAAQYARLVRNCPDPNGAIAGLQQHYGLPAGEPPAVTLARLATSTAPQQHKEVLAHLKSLARSKLLNRSAPGGRHDDERSIDEEASRLSKFANVESSAIRLFPRAPGFSLLEREIRLYTEALDDFPDGTRLLLDYPLESPRLFPVNCSCEFGEICEAIADAYASVYAESRRHGVILHDLSDLVIEDLLFFPEQKLLYPHVGS
jgi:hypothetical protein